MTENEDRKYKGVGGTGARWETTHVPVHVHLLRVRFAQRHFRRHVPEAPRVARHIVRFVLILPRPHSGAQAKVEQLQRAVRGETDVVRLAKNKAEMGR
jgi:hypothetical protein